MKYMSTRTMDMKLVRRKTNSENLASVVITILTLLKKILMMRSRQVEVSKGHPHKLLVQMANLLTKTKKQIRSQGKNPLKSTGRGRVTFLKLSKRSVTLKLS